MSYTLRTMEAGDWEEVASLIRSSTNAWYESHGRPPIFTGAADATLLFCEVYESLDPGCCILAVDEDSGTIAGSCFYHPRPTHMSLGIMNVHPAHFGKGIARRLLQHITDLSDAAGTPTRLVSSALNLDSFSLYTRAGFVPRMIFQDMLLEVPPEGLPLDGIAGSERVRDATSDDLEAIVSLEREIAHIERPGDHRSFLGNGLGVWHVSVIDSPVGHGIDGYLVSVKHPGSTMLGPGVMRTQDDAATLIRNELNHHRGGCPVWLVPVEAEGLVRELYRWGARNCELHLAQVRGRWQPPAGIVMPTFMPETM
jgi:GNAT superfamily N-acetyltransferase